MRDERLSPAARAVLVLWLLLWARSMARPLRTDPDLPARALALARADAEGKRAIVYGADLSRFLVFCAEHLADRATYSLIGIDRDSIDWARAVYRLYPAHLSEHPRFILVYKTRGFEADGASLFAALDDESFILESSARGNNAEEKDAAARAASIEEVWPP